MYRVTVEVILDVDDEGSACDAVNEILRDQQRSFAPQSCLLDYSQHSHEYFDFLDAATYEEGDAFNVERLSDSELTSLVKENIANAKDNGFFPDGMTPQELAGDMIEKTDMSTSVSRLVKIIEKIRAE